jgi:hypothetical protein
MANTLAPTAPLEDFAHDWRLDDMLVWRISQGHLVNLLDEAMDRLDLMEDEPPAPLGDFE